MEEINSSFQQDAFDQGEAFSSEQELHLLGQPPGASAQDLARLIRQPLKFRTDRHLHGRKKFGDDQPTTAFPDYLRKLELEVFRPELTDDQKLELLRASVTGEHAETLAEALEEAAVTFASYYPATDVNHHTMKSPVKGRRPDVKLRLRTAIRRHPDHGDTCYPGRRRSFRHGTSASPGQAGAQPISGAVQPCLQESTKPVHHGGRTPRDE